MPLRYIDYFKLKTLEKTEMEGDAFWTPLICLWQIFQKELNCPKSPPREFHHTGKTDSHQRGGDQKATSHPDKLYHTPSHLPSLLRAYCSFLKIIYSPLSGLCPPSPALTINNKVYKLSNLTLFGYSLFIPCDALVYTTWKINKSVYIFSAVNQPVVGLFHRLRNWTWMGRGKSLLPYSIPSELQFTFPLHLRQAPQLHSLPRCNLPSSLTLFTLYHSDPDEEEVRV